MPLLDPTDPRPIHFMGIGGAGMSALAELCQRVRASERRNCAIVFCDYDS